MKAEDVRDYFALRKLVANPWEVVRFRKRGGVGDSLVVRFREEPPVFLRGGAADFHMFHRINLRDEYQIAGHDDWECVVDVGGNVGLFAARAARSSRRVITYEPVPANFERLKLNCDSRPNVEAVAKAVAGRPGRLKIYRPNNPMRTGVHSSFPEMGGNMSSAYDEVEAITLDEIFRLHDVKRCDLLKLDVEGQEYDILHAASDDTFGRIRRIHAEYHNVQPDDPRTRIDHFSAFLRERGFETDVVAHRRKANHGMVYAGRPA